MYVYKNVYEFYLFYSNAFFRNYTVYYFKDII